ncbi:MAG: M56 family metallopeptidase [Lewinellaceae bacterium]|nr:M56 family metallopeptidase [Lewinellaceae bacterium]
MLTYLLHVTICWSLFALLYTLLLRRETFFRANRFYLLLTVALGLTLPIVGHWLRALLPLPDALPAELPALFVGLHRAEQTAAEWPALTTGLWAIYLIGAMLAAARILRGLAILYRMAATGRQERLPDGAVLIRTDRARLPFSFFHWIFIPEHSEAGADFEKMLAHEQAHVRDRHSADVLLLELLCAAFWFHPLAHWYRRSLRTVHEFLADAAASRQTDRRQYGLLLLRQAQPLPALVMANHFYQAPLKQRLLMLTRQASPAIRGWKYGMALPVLALLVFYFQKNAAEQRGPFVEKQPVHMPAQLEKQPEFPGGIPGLIEYLSKNIQYPAVAREQKIEGKIVVTFVVDQTGAVTQVETVRVPDAAPGYPEMAAEATRIIRQMPRWTPAETAGRPVSCRLSLPIQFKLETGE